MASVRLRRYEAEDGQLPPVCLVCGGKARSLTSKVMRWHPSWVYVLILLGLLPLLIGILLTQKSCRLEAPLCREHKNHWFSRSLVTWLSFLGLIFVIGILVAVLSSRQPGRGDDTFAFVCLGSVVLVLVWLIIVAVLNQTAVRPSEITDRHITLNGVSPEFVDALDDWRYSEEEEEEVRPRGRRTRPPPLPGPDELEEDDRPRRRPRPDAFEERA
jgi:hypothetical protein